MEGIKLKLAKGIEAEGATAGQPNLVGDGFMTVPEAADCLRISKSTVYGLMDSGQLVYAKIGKSRRLPRRAVVGFAESCLRQAR